MSIADELVNYNTFLTNAYTKCEEKKATIPEFKNLQNLEATIDSIKGGGGITVDGTKVSAIAQTTVSAGDRFVGTATGDTPVFSGNGLGVSNFAQHIYAHGISDDKTVLICSDTIYSTDTTIPFYLRSDDGNYELIEAPIEGDLATAITNASTSNVSLTSSTAFYSINEDGTLIYINGYRYSNSYTSQTPFEIMIEVDKENRTGTAYILQNAFCSLEEKNRTTRVRLRGNLLVTLDVDYSDGTKYYRSVYKYTDHHFERIYRYQTTSSTIPNVCETVGDYLIVYDTSGGNMNKIDKNTGEHLGYVETWRPMGQATYGFLTKSGLLSISNGTKGNVYDVNFDGLSYTTVLSLTITSDTMIYPDVSGGYALTSKGIYNLTTGELVTSAYSSNGKYIYSNFDSETGWVAGTNIRTMTPGTDGEYAISRCSSTDFTIESGKVYGVATEDILAGDVGTVKVMFTSPATTE